MVTNLGYDDTSINTYDIFWDEYLMILDRKKFVAPGSTVTIGIRGIPGGWMHKKIFSCKKEWILTVIPLYPIEHQKGIISILTIFSSIHILLNQNPHLFSVILLFQPLCSS